MKRTSWIFLVCVSALLLVSTLASAAPVAPFVWRLGDVNRDNHITTADANLILRHNVGLDTPPLNLRCGDVNSDGKVNSTDALIVLSYLDGMTVPFPVGQRVCSGLPLPEADSFLAWLLANPGVEREAWFLARGQVPNWPVSELVDRRGMLTELGIWHRSAVSPR